MFKFGATLAKRMKQLEKETENQDKEKNRQEEADQVAKDVTAAALQSQALI